MILSPFITGFQFNIVQDRDVSTQLESPQHDRSRSVLVLNQVFSVVVIHTHEMSQFHINWSLVG